MEDLLLRIFNNLIDRVSGPLTFRLILQPVMATIFAVRDGLKDAREGKPAFFWDAVTHPEHRRALFREGWKSTGKVFVLAIIIDAIYQYIVLRWFYPFEAILVAVVLAFIPYLIIRGPVNRLLRHKKS